MQDAVGIVCRENAANTQQLLASLNMQHADMQKTQTIPVQISVLICSVTLALPAKEMMPTHSHC